MSLTRLAERGLLPDALIRYGIRRLNAERLRELYAGGCAQRQQRFERLLTEMRRSPVALAVDEANQQHYEVPAAFFELVLGSHLKYSCCDYSQPGRELDAAEAAMLELTGERAQIEDGMQILELGCGWGSLSLWLAERFPDSRIVAVSNSASQREFILERARRRGLKRLDVVTADMNRFDTELRFDRVISVEMFEHMRNWEELLRRIAGWLQPEGKLFVHVFCHREQPYVFETSGEDNWMGRYFFTAGLMPSDQLLARLQTHMQLEHHWRHPGTDYQQTAEHWLQRLDAQREQAEQLLERCYPGEGRLWLQRWRIFFMACAELWGYHAGEQWWVSHYLLRRRPAVATGPTEPAS